MTMPWCTASNSLTVSTKVYSIIWSVWLAYLCTACLDLPGEGLLQGPAHCCEHTLEKASQSQLICSALKTVGLRQYPAQRHQASCCIAVCAHAPCCGHFWQ